MVQIGQMSLWPDFSVNALPVRLPDMIVINTESLTFGNGNTIPYTSQ